MIPPFESLLACPVDGCALTFAGDDELRSACGRSFPVVDGVPVLFHPDAVDSIGAMAVSRAISTIKMRGSDDPLRLDALDVSPEHRQRLADAIRGHEQDEVDPVVSQMIAATCGNLYLHLVGRLRRLPVPVMHMSGSGLLLDIGCNWGRWSLAAAKAGFTPVGIDPQFGAVLAARRVAAKKGIKAHFVCGDARHLPFRAGVFDAVFSYSVLQHLSEADVEQVLASARRTMKGGALLRVQMPNRFGPRNLIQQARRLFRPARGFEVRYWSLRCLREVFGRHFTEVSFETDCFFGIGLQAADADLMRRPARLLLRLSEALRRLVFLTPVADSVYVRGAAPQPT